MIALSVDLGYARTGLAVSDKNGFLASSLCVITEYNDDKLIEKIAEKVYQTKAEIIVVGLPRNMDGTEGESALNVRAFSEILQTVTGLPVVLQDERGTTVTAYGYLDRTNTYGKKRKAIVDSVAAVIILEDYLRHRRNGL